MQNIGRKNPGSITSGFREGTEIREWMQQRFHESHAKKSAEYLGGLSRSDWCFLSITSKRYNTDMSSNQQGKKLSSVQVKNSVITCVVCLFLCQTSWLVILWFLQSLTLVQVGYITQEGEVWSLSICQLKENISQKRIQNPVKHLGWSILGWQLTAKSYLCKTLHLRCMTGFWITWNLGVMQLRSIGNSSLPL